MKKIVSLLVLTAVTSAYGQIQAVPAPATPDPAAQAAPAGDTAPAAATSTAAKPAAAPAKAVSTSVTTAKKDKPKAPVFAGSLLSEVSRGANINHSKVLDADAPDKRVESSLFFSGTIKYKGVPKNTFSLNQRIAKDIVKNPTADKDNAWQTLNTRVTWTRATDMTLLGSGAVALPFGLELPTNEDARQKGFVVGLRFTPSID